MKSGNLSMTNSMIRALIAIINGNDTLELLQKELHASKSWLARVVERLEASGFVEKIRNGISVRIHLASTSHARSFQNMYLEKPYIDYPKLFSGRNLDVLLSIVTGAKNTRTIAKLMHVQPRIIRVRIRFLSSRGLIFKTGGLYGISSSQKDVIDFMLSLRHYSTAAGRLLWKFGSESLVKARHEQEILGKLTGMNRYGDFGIAANIVSYLFYIGNEQLTAYHIFIHSLFEIEDQRTLALAMVFYVKNSLHQSRPQRKITELAEKYDKINEVREFNRIIGLIKHGQTDIKIESKWLPMADMREILREFKMYEVKNVSKTNNRGHD